MRWMIPALALAMVAGHAHAQGTMAPATAPTTPAPAATAPASPAPSVSTQAAPATKPAAKPAGKTASTSHMTLQQRFDAANTTHDGHLTKEQARSAKMTQTVRHFDAIDKDHKGYVTMDDLHAYASAQRAQHRTTPAAKPAPTKS
ncbi:EF-hand domain-containing protein [Limobrevibacterium gyesilva]|uniref:EF-hand domain-containing protein n=1 Tax=Limobrevibacterium gyesilva TaxID=2991712 RepID=A0AA42CHZ3_9PROT|nr:EF-hand domain-containing protein [Limobrevibacterium gyesilva]MCW3475457.1 EF-hand domain-containing protein [Limobrevibacterium gyesilva]